MIPLLAALLSLPPGEEPLRTRIDRALDAAHVGKPAPIVDDAAFLRRIALDLVGALPSAAEVRAFLADGSPDKRAKAVDRLLASRAFARHMARTFDVMLMERRADKEVKSPEWRKYLFESFAAAKPYDALAREILGADGVDAKLRPAAKFILEREVEPNAVTRDVGRMFFGMDLQCAQCHDHPRIEDYVQRDYYGLYAFLGRSYLFKPDKKKPGVVAEKAEGEAKFKSVFTGKEGLTGPRLPGGREIPDPAIKKGEEYKVKPDKKKKTLRPIPRHSRHALLAAHATDGTNRAFNLNIANRLWAHMMGRGLVEPVDFHHSHNPPAHPDLLETLGGAIVAMKFDVRSFLRELALTKAYQRSFELDAEVAAQAGAAKKRLADLQADAKRIRKAYEESTAAIEAASKELEAARKALPAIAEDRKKADGALAESRKASEKAQKTLMTLKEAAATSKEAAAALPGDKELAAAAGTIQSRVAKVAAEAAKASKRLAAAEKAARDSATRADAAAKKVRTLEERLETARARTKAERVAAQHAESRVGDAEALIAYGGVHAAAERSRSELESARRESETVKLLAEAASKVEAVRKKIPDDKELAAAAAKFIERYEREKSKLAAIETRAAADAAKRDAALSKLVSAWTGRFAVAGFPPLTPEQLCWSMARATGKTDLLAKAGGAEFDKKPPKGVKKEAFVEAYVDGKLQGQVETFVKLFGGAAGQPQDDFYATADQALFMANGGVVRGWLAPTGGNLADRILKIGDPKGLAEELYLSVLTRRPSNEEIGEVKTYLEARGKDRSAAVQELAWALLSSIEFRFKP